MILPVIHSNGTGAQDLTDAYKAALDALVTAQAKLMRAAPHGRDYYPAGDYAIEQATAEHRHRMKSLIAITDETRALWVHCRSESRRRLASGGVRVIEQQEPKPADYYRGEEGPPESDTHEAPPK